jgi:2,4-dienoyl-CoA reductase-like NADH-dependent reductase (Old Yellow Enzyme family)
MMATLFETNKIKNITLKNRSVRSATWDGMAEEDGFSTREIEALLRQLARCEVGLIISGHAYVHRDGQISPRQLGIFSDRHIDGLSRMAEVVHDAGGKIVVQLAHAGCHADASITGTEPMGPSVMENESGPFCREMTVHDISRMISDFGQAAIRAREAGFDGIQLHAAHGYMMSQFLSPFYNKRRDDYGGSVANRTRIVLQILQKVQAEVGKDYPVMIKLNSDDFIDGGFSVDDMLEVAALLEHAGIDAIELSGGLIRYSGKYEPARQGLLKTEEDEVYYRQAALRYKKKCKVPLMLVGGILSYIVAERLITEGVTDYISLSRPLIREPNLIERWKTGDTRKAACISCNLCLNAARQEHRLYCVVQARAGKQAV